MISLMNPLLALIASLLFSWLLGWSHLWAGETPVESTQQIQELKITWQGAVLLSSNQGRLLRYIEPGEGDPPLVSQKPIDSQVGFLEGWEILYPGDRRPIRLAENYGDIYFAEPLPSGSGDQVYVHVGLDWIAIGRMEGGLLDLAAGASGVLYGLDERGRLVQNQVENFGWTYVQSPSEAGSFKKIYGVYQYLYLIDQEGELWEKLAFAWRKITVPGDVIKVVPFNQEGVLLTSEGRVFRITFGGLEEINIPTRHLSHGAQQSKRSKLSMLSGHHKAMIVGDGSPEVHVYRLDENLENGKWSLLTLAKAPIDFANNTSFLYWLSDLKRLNKTSIAL